MSLNIGLKIHRPGSTVERVTRLAKEAEAVGFDSVWGFDHLNPIDGKQCLEAYSLLSALAVETDDVDLGILVTSVGYRHPALLANIIATIDRISAGRVELGIGAGSKHLGKDDYDAYGIDFPAYRDRMQKVEEVTEIVQQLWTQETTDFDGVFYQLEAAQCGVTPVQRPHPPIVLGSTSKFAVSIATRHAIEINVSTGPGGPLHELPDELSRLNDRIEQFCSDRKYDPDGVRRSVQVFVGEDPISDVATVVSALFDHGADRVILIPPSEFELTDISTLYDSISK